MLPGYAPTDLPKSSASRLLATLHAEGYLGLLGREAMNIRRQLHAWSVANRIVARIVNWPEPPVGFLDFHASGTQRSAGPGIAGVRPAADANAFAPELGEPGEP